MGFADSKFTVPGPPVPHPMIDQILTAIAGGESSSYTAKNPKTTASGRYQFTDSTWKGAGGTTARAADATPAEQDRVAAAYVERILAGNGRDLRAVPATWYSGSFDPNHLDYVPHPEAGNTLTVRAYVNNFGNRLKSGAIDVGTWDAVKDAGANLPVIGDALQGIDAVGHFFSLLSSWSTWQRVLEVLGGVLLIGAAVALVANDVIPAPAKNAAALAVGA